MSSALPPPNSRFEESRVTVSAPPAVGVAVRPNEAIARTTATMLGTAPTRASRRSPQTSASSVTTTTPAPVMGTTAWTAAISRVATSTHRIAKATVSTTRASPRTTASPRRNVLTQTSIRLRSLLWSRWRAKRSRFDHYWNDHRPASDRPADPAADGAPDDLLELVLVAHPVAGGLGERLLHLGDDVPKDLLVLDEPAGGDLRTGRDLPGGRVNDDDAGDEPLVAQDAPVLEQRLGRAADRLAVDVDVPARHRADEPGPAVDEVDDTAVGRDDDALAWHPRRHGQLGVGDEVPPLAVDRHDVLGLDDVVDVEQLAGAGVA